MPSKLGVYYNGYLVQPVVGDRVEILPITKIPRTPEGAAASLIRGPSEKIEARLAENDDGQLVAGQSGRTIEYYLGNGYTVRLREHGAKHPVDIGDVCWHLEHNGFKDAGAELRHKFSGRRWVRDAF